MFPVIKFNLANFCLLTEFFFFHRGERYDWYGHFASGFNGFGKLVPEIIGLKVEIGTFSINLNLLNEPLTNPELVKMIKYAKARGIVDVHFHSHGGLLTEKKSIELLDSGLD